MAALSMLLGFSLPAPASYTKMQAYKATIGFPAGAAELYHFRGKDSGAPGGTVAYVSWFGDKNNTAYSGIPPYGGPIIDIVFRRIQ